MNKSNENYFSLITSKIPVDLAFDFFTLNDVHQCLEYLTLWYCKIGCIQLFDCDKIVDLNTVLHQDLTNKVIAKLPQVDHTDYKLQKQMENRFNNNLRMLYTFSIKQFLIDLKLPNDFVNMARVICTYLKKNVQFYFNVAVTENSWDSWNTFRNMTGYSLKLGIVLCLTKYIPTDDEISRWIGEPVHGLSINIDIFVLNKKGYPVLSKEHEDILKIALQQKWTIVLSGDPLPNMLDYFYYIMFIAKNTTISSPMFEYNDILQLPLQPLRDNLTSSIYHVFELDPVKYTQYQKAIYTAIIEKKVKKIILAVIGAGRGPLVKASLRAADLAAVDIKVYAVEKNENAIPSLLLYQKNIWGNSVEVVFTDGRDWDPPEKCDIMVSELLGSFGDNELSPECLDGAQKCLKDDGISIPCEYSSYLRPVMSHKLFSQTINNNITDESCASSSKVARFEQSYIVSQQNSYKPTNTQKLFSFKHPKKVLDSNSRYKCLKFQISSNMQLHGFSGYFDAILYKDIIISIEPSTYSFGMFSWFPVYFPIKDTMLVKSGNIISVHFWRCCDDSKVWYEWCVSSPKQSSIHNCRGKSSSMQL
ncbi:Protein arginine N-methyltransferase PRMT5,PRMT5 arginine-N-methyltransferase,Protein arginine N- [Cinara cedri]|uniref:Protein arginine N-methyltransferase PRMT5,PRMT5 arginine-N-methyltransferase,Protein arginine N n=1 Tax=Cinara cedri TaxID=506608 RepID=A0A5E4MHM0_9HEMI|nr:Protein arginine N-methyltransferase PRMT5,PRMT5 arginine-N-methyltransferase,Protein arginine N- [Cinara cedri]